MTPREPNTHGLRNRITVLLVFAIIAAAYYFLFADGRLPSQSHYTINIEALRKLANAESRLRPQSIEVEIIASDKIPFVAAQAGLNWSEHVLERAVFRLRSDWGETLIDVGLDRAIALQFDTGKQFNDDAFQRVVKALEGAMRVVVSHEHPDHLGYLARYAKLEQIAGRLRLTSQQISATAIYAEDGIVPPALQRITAVPTGAPVSVAPGVVMVPAAGHTPGSVMYFVRMAGGREYLFLGDVVWAMSNIREATGRPRLVQRLLMQTPEDRDAVYAQLAAIIDFNQRHPQVELVPSHDGHHIRELVQAGKLVSQFRDLD